MVAPCGHSFSRESIERWVRDDAKHFCPLCRQALTLDQLHPNFSLRDAVEKCAPSLLLEFIYHCNRCEALLMTAAWAGIRWPMASPPLIGADSTSVRIARASPTIRRARAEVDSHVLVG